MRHFIISIPESVIQDAKEVSEHTNESDEYFLQRVIETMSVTLGRPSCEYTDIHVNVTGPLQYVLDAALDDPELVEHYPDLTPEDVSLLHRLLEQLRR